MNFEEVTYNNGQCICEHPQIIRNPLLPELLARFGKYVLGDGKVHEDIIRHRHLFHPELSRFNAKKLGVSVMDINRYFVVDSDSGETYPIFIQVPCDKCDVCQERKVNAFVQRMEMESQLYDVLPWFVTLTYDNKHLPDHGSLCKRDVQLFWKRFRINMERAGYKGHMRYVLCGQYGPETLRPHYHAVIYNIQSKSYQQWLEVKAIMQRSWSNGEVRRPRLVDCQDNKTFYYTARYMCHESPLPKGCESPFILSSLGHGGIGSKFIDNKAEELRHTLNPKFQWLNKFSGQLKTLVFSRYVLNRVFPSWCRQVPPVLRSALAEWSLGMSILKRQGIDLLTQKYSVLHEKILSKFQAHCFCGDINLFEFSCKDFPQDVVQHLEDCYKVIQPFFTIDFSRCQRIADLRNRFIFKLFEFATPVDIGARAYAIRCRRGEALARCIL